MSQLVATYEQMGVTKEKRKSSFLKSREDKIMDLIRAEKFDLAYAKMYDYYPKIKKMLLNFGASEDDAKDIFQESILIVSNKLEDSTFQLNAKISTYLYSVSRYVCKDFMAKKNKVISIDQFHSLTEEIVIDHEAREQQFDQMDQILQNLGERCKQILIAYYYKKRSMKEIAEEFQYATVGSAKNQKYKCLERAKKMADLDLVKMKEA